MSMREEEIVEKPKKRNPLILIATVIIGIAVIGAGAYYLGGVGRASGEEAPPESKSIAMEPFTVNLADMNYRRFLRVRITLEYVNEMLPKELEKYRYKVRDAIISVLRSKNVQDIDTQEKTEKLRGQISGEINKVLEPDVENIYFEEFIIQ